MRGFRNDVSRETGTDSAFDQADYADYTGVMYEGAGRSIPVGTVAVPFYGTNTARFNGADLEPIPITPVRKQNWPEMQIQLRNGWGALSFGKKLTYDDYLRLMTDSATKNRNYLIPQPSSVGRAGNTPGPAPGNVTQMVQAVSGNQPNNPGGPGMVAASVNLTGRRYYG